MNGMASFRALLFASLVSSLFIGCDINFTMVDGYSFDFTGQKTEKTESGSFDDGVQEIEVENKFGDIKVTLATDDEPGWSWDAAVWADSEELSAVLLEDTFLDIQTIDGKQIWKLVLPESKSDLNGVTSNLTFRVPAGMQVNLQNSHGNLDISKLDGKLDARNRHGDVALLGLSGESSIENSHGNLSANDVTDAKLTLHHGNVNIASAQGKIHFEGSHGSVVAEDIEGDLVIEASHMGVEVSRVTQAANISSNHNNIKVSGVVGDATIDNQHGDIVAKEMIGNIFVSNAYGDTVISTSAETVEVHSRYGAIEIEIENPEFRSILAETSHEDVKLWLPASVTASIDTSTTHGDTESEFESDAESSQNVSVKTQHGDIEIMKRSIQ
jgi:hypothetical protein